MINPEEIANITIYYPAGHDNPGFTMKWCFIPSTGDTVDISGVTYRVRDVVWMHDNGMCDVSIYLVVGVFPAE